MNEIIVMNIIFNVCLDIEAPSLTHWTFKCEIIPMIGKSQLMAQTTGCPCLHMYLCAPLFLLLALSPNMLPISQSCCCSQTLNLFFSLLLSAAIFCPPPYSPSSYPGHRLSWSDVHSIHDLQPSLQPVHHHHHHQGLRLQSKTPFYVSDYSTNTRI